VSLFGRVRSVYRAVFPEPLRRFVRNRLVRPGYSPAFFDHLDELQAASYDVMAGSIVEQLHPRFAVDVGCGSGALLAALAARGVRTLGLEGSPAGVASARRRKIDVRLTDLAQPFEVEPCDVVISLEVAEHLPESAADQFVASLASAAPHIVFSAATPGQGGLDHINEQPHAYWIEKFSGRGFTVDEETTQTVREHWRRSGVASWYCKNVLFLRGETSLVGSRLRPKPPKAAAEP
jgi:trans-aconitate methyltransferase